MIDLDLEKFFDRVNHDKLMGQLAKRVEDKRLLKLIRAFLNAGVMENGLVSPSVEGTPQGGPLSPLLSNLVLDELDRELERRGHRYLRYADDCNIYVRSQRAGQRVMEGITRFITNKLKLKVNETKSAVARPQGRKFLGFSLAPVQKLSALSRRKPWNGLSTESGTLRVGPKASARLRHQYVVGYRMKAVPRNEGGAALSQGRRDLAVTGFLPVPEGVDRVLHGLARHVDISAEAST